MPRVLLISLLLGALLAACGQPGEDVRLTLCKDLVSVRLGAVPDWRAASIETRGYEGAVARVRSARQARMT